MTRHTKEFNDGIVWLKNEILKDYNRPENDNQQNLSITTIKGRKFIKVILKMNYNTQVVWGFIAKSQGQLYGLEYYEGDVFKAASLTGPAKHTRGTIFKRDTNWFTWTGPNYIKL